MKCLQAFTADEKAHIMILYFQAPFSCKALGAKACARRLNGDKKGVLHCHVQVQIVTCWVTTDLVLLRSVLANSLQ